MDEFATYYDLFNLRPGSSHQDLKNAYKRLAKQWHPDRFVDDPVNAKIAEEKIKTINIAYEALKARQGSAYFSSTTRGAVNYTTSVTTRRSSPQDYYNNAKRLIKLGQYREAAEELGHAIKLNPNYAAAYHLRGILFSVLGFENRASSDFKRALDYGVRTVDYDDEVIEFIKKNPDLQYLKYLLKKQPSSRATEHQQKSNSDQTKPYQQNTKSEYQEPDDNQPKKADFSVKLIIELDYSKIIAPITVIAVSINNKTLASGCRNGSIYLWNCKNKHTFHRLDGHTKAITHLIFSPDNQILFSSSADGTIRLWNLSNSSFIKRINAHEHSIRTFAVDYKAKSLMTIGATGEAKIWDFRQGQLLKLFSYPENSTTSVIIGFTGLFTLCGSTNGSIHLCNIPKGGTKISIMAHSQPVQALAFSSKSQTFASGSANGEVGMWKFPSGDRRRICQSVQNGMTALTFCHQGRLLCGADNQGRIMIWDVASGALLDTACAHAPGHVSLITMDDEGLLSAGADGRICQWRFQFG